MISLKDRTLLWNGKQRTFKGKNRTLRPAEGKRHTFGKRRWLNSEAEEGQGYQKENGTCKGTEMPILVEHKMWGRKWNGIRRQRPKHFGLWRPCKELKHSEQRINMGRFIVKKNVGQLRLSGMGARHQRLVSLTPEPREETLRLELRLISSDREKGPKWELSRES